MWETLGANRRSAVIASKVFNPMGPGPNDSGTSRAHIMRAVEDSLRRLGTDHLDLYYIHHLDVQTPLEEMLRAMDDLVRQGKVRYPAVSNFEAWRLMEALWTSDSRNLARFECYPAAVQPGGARHRAGDRAGLRAEGTGRGGVVAARRRLPIRQVPAGPEPG